MMELSRGFDFGTKGEVVLIICVMCGRKPVEGTRGDGKKMGRPKVEWKEKGWA